MSAEALGSIFILTVTFLCIAAIGIGFAKSDRQDRAEEAARNAKALERLKDYHARTREEDLLLYKRLAEMEAKEERIKALKKPKLTGSGLGFSGGRRRKRG